MYADILVLELFTAPVLVLLLGRNRRIVEALSVASSLLAAVLSLLYAVFTEQSQLIGLPLYNDPLSKLMLCVVNVLGFLIVVYSLGYMGRDPGYTRYYSLILLFVASMSLLVLSTDIVILYLSWELVGVCSALLISFWWEKPEARRAGLKAFTVTRIGDIGLIIAIAMMLTTLKTTHIPAVLLSFSSLGSQVQAVALLLVLAAIGKSAQFPLFVWLPDAMEGPTSVSALIHAATMVKAGVYLLSRFYPLISSSEAALSAITWISITTVLLSALSALGASDVKKVLAYSTINHLGLMFLALGLGAWTAAQLHLVSHSLFKALLFLCAGLIIHESGTRDLDKVWGLWSSGLRITGVAFLIGSLSLAGVPPLPGYFSKELILTALGNRFMGSWGEVLVFIVSFLSTLYIFRLYFRLFTGCCGARRAREKELSMLLPILALALLTLGGYFLLVAASSLLGVEPELSEVNPTAVLGVVAGMLLSYSVWVKMRGEPIRRAVLPLARIADRGFYVDALYTLVASRIMGSLSSLSVKLQRGIPSVNTLWLMGLFLILLTVILGVT
ncbi:NADH-quinone oxidoreductase subunit L [Infirmifilum lucidum]|uniref:NADH-quinone oxidoreductase subunit L n=1 Tax=Infirmifilum lucidum TaxID=2776706 RepID=A0A7L9FKI7_9CREN|nr:NADH-quinone oxidoreductase subunit L [Infirmifilum lucidum]QOJ79325.1 NADH-quinone oxidoreductase subunit L [Infirmifilum lucidum]